MQKTNTLLALAMCGLAFSYGVQAQVPPKKPLCKAYSDMNVAITQPGTYCLRGSLTGAGIKIQADDVVLDLKGFSVRNDKPAPDSPPGGEWAGSIGIFNFNNHNVTVKNGTVIGYAVGVYLGYDQLNPGSGYTVENLLVRSAKVNGIAVGSAPNGTADTIVRNNIVSDTVGRAPVGIYVGGTNGTVVVENNRVDNTRGIVSDLDPKVFPTLFARGILVSDITTATISGNVITNTTAADDAGHAVGLFANICTACSPNPVAIISGNYVLNPDPATNSTGIYLGAGIPTPSGTPSVNVSTSRVYNFNKGIDAATQPGVVGATSNVVSGAVTPYSSRLALLSGNRTE